MKTRTAKKIIKRFIEEFKAGKNFEFRHCPYTTGQVNRANNVRKCSRRKESFDFFGMSETVFVEGLNCLRSHGQEFQTAPKAR